MPLKTKPSNIFSEKFPELAAQWHPVKNGDLLPSDISSRHSQKVWWQCENGHEWEAKVFSRTSSNSMCPYCSGRLAHESTSLAKLFPEVTSEWHPVKNANTLPQNIRPGSDFKAWWICKEGHEWQAAVSHRTNPNKPTGCPFCSGRRATTENNLSKRYPRLLLEWDYEKNGTLNPEELKPGSNIKVWWKCQNGHEWKTSLNKRTSEGTNCPYCTSQTSKLEIRLFCELSKILESDIVWRHKVDSIEIDIYFPTYSLGLEIDGYPWHHQKIDKDLAKTKALSDRGIKLFRLRDSKLQTLDKSDLLYESLEDGLPIILRLLPHLLKNIDFDERDSKCIQNYIATAAYQNEDEYNRILSYLPSPPPEYSLATAHKHLINEWHFEKNSPLTPENFNPSARSKVWWICQKGHEYQAFIYNRAVGKGCPFCAGKKVSDDNSLLATFPDVAKQWHYEKNSPLTPDQVYHGSNVKAWWQCDQGHEWQSRIIDRTRKGYGCPYCLKRLINSENSLESTHPEIARQWHPF